MLRFDTVYMAPRVRVALNNLLPPQYIRKFWELVDRLAQGRFDIKGLRVEKLHTKRGKVYSARLNVEIRVIFSMFGSGHQRSLVIWDANHHDDAYDRVSRACVPFLEPEELLETIASWGAGGDKPIEELQSEVKDLDTQDVADGLVLFTVPHFVLSEPSKYAHFEANIDRYLRLTSEQEELIKRTDQSYLVQGSAGTGKTTLALFHALNLYELSPEDDVFFFTYQEELACVCRCYKVNLVGEESNEESCEQGGLKVFSYLEFARHYLQKSLQAKPVDWQWIDRDASLKCLKEIIDSKSRWSRTIVAEDTYSYIYSILKGRFVPGTDRFPESQEDYRRIFKGYGTTPKNLEDIMGVFELYQSRLAVSSKRDEADLIRFCYQNMKETASLSADRRSTWIVIDEIQDFTELEWKSILLFWENKCIADKDRLSFPFLSGDRNQNISRSGFRWQEVSSYIEAILKKMHRPNALVKVNLHNNIRNTLEVFNLGKFIAQQGPETSLDIGVAPKFSSFKPVVVVGEESQFLDFLSRIAQAGSQQLPQPLVVLFEDEADMKSMRRKLPVDDGLFLMPLRKSKGMEFEDCIIYRLFACLSQIDKDIEEDLRARLFDLWYMSVMRARKGLLIYLTPSDWTALQEMFSGSMSQFEQLVDLKTTNVLAALEEFYQVSEKYLPNYNVIFLERVKAQESWDEAHESSSSNDQLSVQLKQQLQEQALRLWKKCRDWKALGIAYKDLGRHEEAIPYLQRSNCTKEVAWCFEQLGKYGQAAESYEEAQLFVDAARCYEQCGHHQRAAELYEAERQWLKAATNYSAANQSNKAAFCFERAEHWQEAADVYCLRGHWLKAAEMFTKCQQYEEAASMYLKVKDKLDAARCYISGGQHIKAAALLESLNRWIEAAQSYEQAGVFDKAAVLYAKAGRLKELASCSERVNDWPRAASAYERMKSWDKAAAAYLQAGMKAKAAECFENGLDWAKAKPLLVEINDPYRLGRCSEQMGDAKSAIEYYLQTGAYNEAAYCCEKIDALDLAADYYLKANNLHSAAPILVKLGRRFEASQIFLLCGQVGSAMEMARCIAPGEAAAEGKQGDLRLMLAQWAESKQRIDLAAEIYEHVGQYMLAADRYKKSMLLGKAAICFEKDHKFALAADLYLQDGQLEKAGACFQSAKQWKKAAQCFEKSFCWIKAQEMYMKCGDEEAARRCQTNSVWF